MFSSQRNGESREGEDRLADLLRKIPIFAECNKRELAAVERILHRREYLRDEVIFHQDDPGLGMYIIETGKVAIIAEPSRHVLSELGDGEFFGELALLTESPRSATAVALTPCKALGFFQPDLFGLIERNPRLGVKIVLRLAAIIGDRLRKANDQIQTARGMGAGDAVLPERPASL
jgi:CRP-like cAMP-binding protein